MSRGVMPHLFEWTPAKAAENLKKHGVSFDEATESFADLFSLNMPDPSHTRNEERYLVLGLSRSGRLLVVSNADRGSRTRLISARRGKAARRYREGTNVVILDPDVRELFPDSTAVNEALRTFARLIRPRRASRSKRGSA